MYITSNKWLYITKVLIHKNKYSTEDIDKLYKIIYTNYENWAFYNSYKFKKFHYYKCKQISQQELNLYASLGLIKAIQNFNPKNCYSFSSYASKYIIGELYNGMTILQPIHSLNKRESKKSIYNRNENIKMYSLLLNDKENYIIENALSNTEIYNTNIHNKYFRLWEEIFAMDIPVLTKNIIKLKYSFDFKKIRSNKKISILLCCSEENIRQHNKIFSFQILNLYKNNTIIIKE
jgi:RNA polymerase sigma factor (sigma-70 family)